MPLPEIEPTVVLVDASPLIHEGLPEDVIVVTSRTFLSLAQRSGHLADADAVWAIVASRDPRANPTLNYQIIQAPRQ